MSEKRGLGPNMQKLLARVIAARTHISPGGGLQAGIDLLITPGKLGTASREALAWIDTALDVMRSAPDNPYGEDEEDLAEAILNEINTKS
ncbi:MAG: hypothetical protein KAS32_13460 [Candidatus Peribacteraceae bacterium]|nr:hypothetical protein [Candidatus Peribacteraceae bacterium]